MASNDTKESGFSDEEDGAVTADGHRSARVLHDTDQSAGSINVTTEDDEDLSPFEAQTETTIVPPEWIGNIRCFWPDDKGRPRITIGPNWYFTICLGFLVCATLWISLNGMVGLYEKEASWVYLLGGALVICSGLFFFFACLLGDPGIPEEVYKLKARPYARIDVLPSTNEKGHHACYECNVYMHANRVHCDLCNVCIDNLDHHCVFYSKCIGGGNVWYFRLSICSFIINMAYFIIVMFTTLTSHKKHEHLL